MEVNIRKLVPIMIVVAIWCATIEQSCGAADLSFNLVTAATGTYTNLMKSVRDKVKDPNLHYGGTDLPVIGAPKNPPNYLYIDIKADKGTITIGFSKNDLYVVGYLQNINGIKKANFFQDATQDAFPDANQKVSMGFKGNYGGLEGAAEIKRENLGLGGVPLKKIINTLYEKGTLDTKNQARLMLIVVQMFSEAARFKYIQYKIGPYITKDAYYPDAKALILENNWEVTTKSIKTGDKNKVPFLTIKTVEWKTFNDLVNDMGLLKYEGSSVMMMLEAIYYYFNNVAYQSN